MDSGPKRPPLLKRLQIRFRLATSDRLTALIDQGIVSATNALTTIFIARACSKDELGLYAAGFSLIVLAFTVQKALIITPYTVLSPRVLEDSHREYRGSTLAHNFAMTVLIAAALLTAGIWLLKDSRADNQELAAMLIVLSVSGSFIMLREFARLVAIADLAFRQALAVDACAVTIQIGGLAVLWKMDVLNASTAFFVSGTASGIAALGWIVRHRSTFRVLVKNLRPDLERNWKFGKWLFGSSFLRQTSESIYPWMIIYFHGTAEAGVWASCVAVVALYNPVMLALYNEAAPRIAHASVSGRVEELSRAVSETTRLCSLAASPFFVVLLLCGGSLVTLVYGPNYEGNALTVSLLAASAFVLAFGFGFPYGLLALNRPILDFAGNLASFAVLMTIGIWAARSYGAVGSAIGLLITHGVGVSVKAYSFKITAARSMP